MNNITIYGHKLVTLAPCAGRCFKNRYELLNQRALKISMLYTNRIFQCIGNKYFVLPYSIDIVKTLSNYFEFRMNTRGLSAYIARWLLELWQILSWSCHQSISQSVSLSVSYHPWLVIINHDKSSSMTLIIIHNSWSIIINKSSVMFLIIINQ